MSCFGGKDEQLYLLELMVGRLNLVSEKIKEVGDCRLVVKIKFIDFPVFEISRNDFNNAGSSSPPDYRDGSLEYSAGKSCLFTKQPRDLVRSMQSSPLRIGVFCLGDTYPIAESEIPLSGCLCDQVAMAMNDPDHLPKPYKLKGGFHLGDPGGNPSGSITLDLRLTCFGKSITTHYQLQPDAFLFKNDKDDGEFCVKRVVPPSIGDQPMVTDASDDAREDGKPDEIKTPVEKERKGKKGGKKKGAKTKKK